MLNPEIILTGIKAPRGYEEREDKMFITLTDPKGNKFFVAVDAIVGIFYHPEERKNFVDVGDHNFAYETVETPMEIRDLLAEAGVEFAEATDV